MRYSRAVIQLIYLFSGSVLSTLSNAYYDEEIQKETDASENNFPYQVSIRKRDRPTLGEHSCGGSIISAKWILTSALCIFESEDALTVVVGTIYLDHGGEEYEVAKIVVHPDFYGNGGFYNDIGLIKVKYEITFDEFIQPIKLVNESDSADNQILTLSGWGHRGVFNLSNRLQFGIVNPISPKQCHDMTNRHISSSHFCTISETQKEICYFDLGSPLVNEDRNLQYAIATIYGSCEQKSADVYTLVAPYRSWIKRIAEV